MGIDLRVRVSLATVIMISFLLKDISDGFVAIPIQMIEEITYKIRNLIAIFKLQILSVMKMEVRVVCSENNVLFY